MTTWKHTCGGNEICSRCGKKALPNEVRIWHSSQDQDDLFCIECAELNGLEVIE